jgi:hypothetical protein
MYTLRGEVRWVRFKDEMVFVGVLLIATDDTDLERWLMDF